MKALFVVLFLMSFLNACGNIRSKQTVEDPVPAEIMEDSSLQDISYVTMIQEHTRGLIGEQAGVGAVVVVVSPKHTEILGLGARTLNGPPVDRNTVFQIASLTKTITGFIFASLIESSEPLIKANDAVNEHLKEMTVPSYENIPITLEHLATHYSSLPNFPNNLIGPMWSPGQGYTRQLLSAYLSGEAIIEELTQAPGTQYQYSNLGYGLLGLSLVDATEARDYKELLESHFINPLALTSTGLNHEDFLTRVNDHLAQGYGPRDLGRPEVDYTSMGVLASSGEVFTTGEDLALFLRVLCGLDSFVIEGAVDRALEPRMQGIDAQIAYGWDVTQDASPIWYKSGLTTGFTAFVAFKRDPQVAVAILSNLGKHQEIKDVVFELIDTISHEYED